MHTQNYDLEGLAQSNTVITSSNSEVMTQLSQMTVIMNAMQRQLKILSSAQTNKKISKREHYCWSCRSNYTSGAKPDRQIKRDTNMKPTTRR